MTGTTPTNQITVIAPASNNRSHFDLYWRYALAGAQCCAITHTVLVPIDVVKTRLQVQSAGPAKQYNGMMDAFVKISRSEGPSALLLGLGPTAVGYSVQGACKFGFYEFFKNVSASALGKDKSQLNTANHMLAAGMAEVVASVALCPFEAVRIKMVGQPSFARNMFDGLKKVAASDGVLGFYKGIGPILMKQVPYTVTQLVVFHHVVDNYTYGHLLPQMGVQKDKLSLASKLSISLTGGVIAGVAGAVVSHPADTILSRVNMKGAGSLGTVIRNLGFRGMWLGIGPRCLMVGTLSAGMFLIYDSVKAMCGLPIGGH